MSSYASNKKWREKHPERYLAGTDRNYERSRRAAFRSRNRWEQWELMAIHAENRLCDRALGAQIGRSVQAIRAYRCKTEPL